jgi:tRNA modification GTPase
MEGDDTICAISTAPGQGGIGIIRLSGHKAHAIAAKIFEAKNKRISFSSGKLYLGYVINPKDDRKLDEVLIVFMNAPNTYTREDIVEIYSHGGYGAQKSILSLLLDCGLRIAEPGEFTKRAFLNGRIDLVQAEAVLDIIRSETDEELHCAVKALQGKLSTRLKGFKKDLKEILVSVEALIDFPEEDIDVNSGDILPPLQKTRADIEKLISSYYQGRGIKEGFEVLIVGKTNVGKSSLLNAVLLKERAIVTPFPGTTRDLIEETFYLKGIKIKIIDTAGIRISDNIIEQEGIKRVRKKVDDSDLIILLLDGAQPYSSEDGDILRSIRHRPHLVVINKCDLPQILDRRTENLNSSCPLEVSALTDGGIEELKERIFAELTGGNKRMESLLITNVRHRDALAKVQANIDRAIVLKETEEPLELIAFELHESLYHLSEITGETSREDILQEIFHQFCIGK